MAQLWLVVPCDAHLMSGGIFPLPQTGSPWFTAAKREILCGAAMFRSYSGWCCSMDAMSSLQDMDCCEADQSRMPCLYRPINIHTVQDALSIGLVWNQIPGSKSVVFYESKSSNSSLNCTWSDSLLDMSALSLSLSPSYSNWDFFLFSLFLSFSLPSLSVILSLSLCLLLRGHLVHWSS